MTRLRSDEVFVTGKIIDAISMDKGFNSYWKVTFKAKSIGLQLVLLFDKKTYPTKDKLPKSEIIQWRLKKKGCK